MRTWSNQIRVLMFKAECQRTDDDTRSEEKLIRQAGGGRVAKKFHLDCLEMDRKRELDEVTAIEDHEQLRCGAARGEISDSIGQTSKEKKRRKRTRMTTKERR